MVRMTMPLLLTVMELPHMTLLVSKGQKPVTLIHIEVCLYFNNCRNCKNSIKLAIVVVPTDVTIIAIVIKTAVVIQTVTVTAMAS